MRISPFLIALMSMLVMPRCLGAAPLEELAQSLKLLADKPLIKGKIFPQKSSLLVVDPKVDLAAASTVLTNFCWLAVVDPVVRRKTFVGQMEVSQAGLALLYALALFPEADISLLIKELDKQAQDKTNKSFAEGMAGVKKTLEDLKSKAEANPNEAAAAMIGLFTEKQWNDVLKDLFILLFKEPLKNMGVLQDQSALFIKAMPFALAGGDVIASYTYAFGVILERLKLNKKNVAGFYGVLNGISGYLGTKKFYDAQKRLEPLLKILETGKGWEVTAFKKDEGKKEEDQGSLDDALMAMVIKAFFDELFFDGKYSPAGLSKVWGTQITSGGKAIKSFDNLYLDYFEDIELGQAAFYPILESCASLIKDQKAANKLKSQLITKNMKQVDALKNELYTAFKADSEVPKFVERIRKQDKNGSVADRIADASVKAAYEIIVGLINFYLPVKEKVVEDLSTQGNVHLKIKTVQTTPFIKTAPNGAALFKALVYNEKTEELEMSADPNAYWDVKVLTALVEKTMLDVLKEALETVRHSNGLENPFHFVHSSTLLDFTNFATKTPTKLFEGSEELALVSKYAWDAWYRVREHFDDEEKYL